MTAAGRLFVLPSAPRRLAALALLTTVAAAALGGWWGGGEATPAGEGAVPPDVCVVRPGAPFPGAVHAYDPASGLAMAAARPVPAHARCAVCGMYPARHPGWAAQVIADNGDAWFFDSAVDMLIFLAEPARYTRGFGTGAVIARYVSDHAGGGWIAADQAWVVHGSRAVGPMRGPDLPAFASAAAAEAHAAAQGGRSLRLSEVDALLLAELRTIHAGH